MENALPQKKSFLVWIIIIIVLLVAAGVIYFFATKKGETANTNTAENTTNTAVTNTNNTADPYAALMQYDGRVVNIASTDGKVTGKLAIAYRAGEEMPMQVVYFLKVDDALPKEATSFSGASYFYVANHTTAANVRTGEGTGVLSAITCNPDQMPDVLSLARAGSVTVTTYDGCVNQYEVNASTTSFYQVYSDYYNQYDFDYDKIIKKDTLTIFNSAPFYTAVGAAPDQATVISQAEIAKQYTLTYSE
jgi:hypothetical protein